MKRTLLIAAIFASSYCFSQNNYSMPSVNGQPFAVFFDSLLKKNFHIGLDTLGVHGGCLIKFAITADGKISNLEISPGTPLQLENLLKSIFHFTDGLWPYRNENEWFIIPFQFTLQRNGKTNPLTAGSFILSGFFGSGKMPIRQYTVLPLLEYISPFDGNNNFKQKLSQ